ncbi:hypothetical protein GUITHDRAFT_151053 [Guillardia theta CCMP2712]|uniref:Ribosome biogenesis protein SLX9 n=2 Tax=Guillardia theta TaxID=55529 RepID=L1JRG8_GUITC|nr:hypothetical protein GUITHDRAFT_151053 [Guillardia theta CCMP2712]EKX50688.1 hypothetical protein GUITHDRAFT_151053 [Guillardia theta CCMP2712]|eukprot:XP_005837668.1 hypothetical protein GUITHDRAFT_151053 [Guillardia theta CCMP2712]
MGKAKKPNKQMEDERGGGGEKNAMREKSSDKLFAKPLRGISKQSPSRPAANLGVQNKIIEKMKMSSENMSRGQRKRLAKKSNVIRRKEIGSAIVSKALKIQDGSLGDLDCLTLALPSSQSSAPSQQNKKGPGKMTIKKQRRMLIAESQQLQSVLTHPLFQSNPIGTIHDHLENSIRLSKSV